MGYIHTFLHRCVFYFSKLQRQSQSLGKQFKAWPSFLKSQSMAENILQIREALVKLHSHANHFKTTAQAENGWNAAGSSITPVPGARAWCF